MRERFIGTVLMVQATTQMPTPLSNNPIALALWVARLFDLRRWRLLVFALVVSACGTPRQPGVNPLPSDRGSKDGGVNLPSGPGWAAEDLARQGYPVSVTIAVAVAEFNHRANADSIGRLQPPLTEKELSASILGWSNQPVEFPDSVIRTLQTFAAKGQLARGFYLEFVRGLIEVNHADTDVWWIDLRAALERFPSDRVGVPIYRHRVRTQYLESHRHVE